MLSRIAYAWRVSTRTAERTVSSRRAAVIAGVSYRQIDYWARLGYIRSTGAGAAGSGSRRRWTLDDVQRIAAVSAIKAVMGSNADIEFVLAVVDGRPLDRAVVGGRAVVVPISVDLDPVRNAVADAWPADLS